MSGTLSTASMVAELQRRIPIGLPSSMCLDRLNEAYRWIIQRGPMVWTLRAATVTTSVSGNEVIFSCPSDWDPGKPAYLAGALTTFDVEIPFKPYDVFVRHKLYGTTVSAGQYSVWSYRTIVNTAPANPGVPPILYQGVLLPLAAGGTHTLPFVYHLSAGAALSSGATTYYPSPDVFDSCIIDLAESEVRRIYSIIGWDIVQKRAQEQVMSMLDMYVSTKPAMAGLASQVMQTQASQAAKQE